MADPLPQGCYPMHGLYQALATTEICLQEQATTHPFIDDVVTALACLASQTYDPSLQPGQSNRFAPGTPREKNDKRLSDAIDCQDEVLHKDQGRKQTVFNHAC